MTSRSLWHMFASMSLGLIAACQSSNTDATVNLDVTSLRQHAALTDGTRIDKLVLKVWAPDISPALEVDIDLNNPMFDLNIKSGSDRHFLVTALRTDVAPAQTTYFGEVVINLLPGSSNDLLIPIVAAGQVEGSVVIASPSAIEFPEDFVVTFRRDDGHLQNIRPNSRGIFDYPIAVGHHTISAVVANEKGIYDLNSDFEVTVIQGETVSNIDLVLYDTEYCFPSRGLVFDIDKDGVNCDEDCNDNNPNCDNSCLDDDHDGYCVDHDCDDTREGCAVDCSDNADHDRYCGDTDCDNSEASGNACHVGCASYFEDNDSDGLGTGTAVIACFAPEGYVANDSDCDDSNAEAICSP